ncbi:MAG TPA: glycosyltransferase family 39 protein [bacterium]|jgi:hypothetical protein
MKNLPLLQRGGFVLAAFLLITLLAHLLTATHYPMFRDEFYYLDCANHLDYGYVDQPPFSIFVLDGWRMIFGDSLFAVRLLPSLLAVALMWLTWKITEEMGGGLFARTLACGAAFFSPQLRALAGFYSMNAFDLVFWAAAALILIRIAKTNDSRLWIPFGIIAGWGLLNKISLLYFGAGLIVAMALTPLRRQFARRQFWIGGIMALLLFLPYVLWQFSHEFATLQFIRNATAFKNAAFAPHQFLMEFALENNPISILLWLGGLGVLLFYKPLRTFRFLGWLALTVLVILMTNKGKPYYAAGLFPLLIASGAVWLESKFALPRLKWARLAYAGLLVAGGLLLLPFGLRILNPETYIDYQWTLGIEPKASEKGQQDALWPQHYADSFGWEELAQATVRAYNQLDPEEKKDCVIFARNYGEAGAINYYCRKQGLPEAVCGHNNYYFWGPPVVGVHTVFLVVAKPERDPRDVFDSIFVGGGSDNDYAMPTERKLVVFIGRGIHRSLAEIWAANKSFD